MLGFLKSLFMKPIRNVNPILMVIAESKFTQEAIRRDFESLSCKVIPVFSGQSAWQALEIGPLPDVVIVDFVLTDEDGPEIFSRLKTNKRFSTIPVVPLALHPADDNVCGVNSADKATPSNKRSQSTRVTWNPPTGPTEFNTTPLTLFFSVGEKLRKSHRVLPTKFREKLRGLTKLIEDVYLKEEE
jgi:CheY-like chemotaxis protein